MSRTGAMDPDELAASCASNRSIASVQVKVWSSPLHTYVELWQGGLPGAESPIRVAHTRYPRHTQENPEPMIMAGFLARMVSAMDREGWVGLR